MIATDSQHQYHNSPLAVLPVLTDVGQTGSENQSFWGLTRNDLEDLCVGVGVPRVHAVSVLSHMYRLRDFNLSADNNLPKKLVECLAEQFKYVLPKIVSTHESKYDGSVKFVLELADGAQVEAVLMPETSRMTLCLSSQVGCAQGCVFCHTGRMGLKRHLTGGEIVGEVLVVGAWLRDNPLYLQRVRLPAQQVITNIVFMGMGEPLDNVDAVVAAIKIVTDPRGLAMGLRHISVSTAGHVDGMRQLLKAIPTIRLAVSLHSVNQSERARIMPISKRWPVDELIGMIRVMNAAQKHPVLIQYTLIKGVNDSVADAEDLCRALVGLRVKINLIPLNPIDPSRLTGPSRTEIMAFRDVLHAHGVRSMIRFSKGQDIGGACGQLVRKATPITADA